MKRFALPVALIFLAGMSGHIGVLPLTGRHRVTAILGAFGEEVEIVESQLRQPKCHTLLGIDFIVGELNQRRIVLAQTGVGKVNAAMTTALLVHEFRPREVIFTGVAGGIAPELFPGDIVVGEKLAQP